MAEGTRAFVYILECKDGTLYTGWSTDVGRRVDEHNCGNGGAYTRSRRPVRLVYVEEQPSYQAAMRREREIKRLGRDAKLSLIRDNERAGAQVDD